MEKFRKRLYVKAFIKENKRKSFVCLDMTKFEKSEIEVILRKIKPFVLNSRKRYQSIFLKV